MILSLSMESHIRHIIMTPILKQLIAIATTIATAIATGI